MKWVVAAILVIHGLIHLPGVFEAFGWADVDQLTQPISAAAGVLWLAAAVLLVTAAVMLVAAPRWWWIVGLLGVVVSQVAIVTSWSDAKAGTVANVVILIAVFYGFLSEGPVSYRSEFRDLVASALARPRVEGTVTEDDLAGLPAPVARYVRLSGAVGKPRVYNFRARMHGRIRSTEDASWMHYTVDQVSTVDSNPDRLFFMEASMKGLPADVFHSFVGSSATMRVKVWSLVPMVDARGTEMNRSETVTILNDICVLAPAALINPAFTWEPIDDRSARATFTRDGITVRAVLSFDEAGELVDFVSDDRLRTTDGKAFTQEPWSTPLRDYRSFDGRMVGTVGEARWHAPAPERDFTYVEFNLDDIAYNVAA